MIRIYIDSTSIPLTDVQNWYVDYIDTGIHTMSFDISTNHPLYAKLQEEVTLEYDNLYYKIKTINERTSSDVSTITAELDLNSLRAVAYQQYKVETQTFDYVCNSAMQGILNDTGWTVNNIATVTGKRSMELTDCTPLDILQHCTNTTMYNRRFVFDNKLRKITPVNIDEKQPTGAYFTDELNLSDVNYKGTSTGLVTRLYAYGKDINLTKYAGREYVENHDYTAEVIAAVWRDERYTDERSLYDDAVDKLKQMSKPARSYSCKVADLSALSDKYKFLAVQLYDVVTLIDRNRKTRVNHRVVQLRKYPFEPEKDTVTLSTTAANLTNKLNTLQSNFNTEKIINKSKWNDVNRDIASNTASIGELYQLGDDNKVYLSNLITQTAESTIEQIRYSSSVGNENLVKHPRDFTDTTGWIKTNGSAWSMTTENNYLKLTRLDTTAGSNLYAIATLTDTANLSGNKNNYISVYARIKATMACRIYLCWKYTDSTGAQKTSVLYPAAVKASNFTKYGGDIFYTVTDNAINEWVDLYAQIYSPTSDDITVSAVGIYFASDTTAGNAPKGLVTYLDYFEIKRTPYYEDRITTIEKSADGIKTEVEKKASSTDLTTLRTEMTQKFDSIKLTATNGISSSNLALSVDGVNVSSANIKLTGMVTFSNLSTAGSSSICGDNITTGTISSTDGKCKIKLASSTIDFQTSYYGGLIGRFELSPSGIYFMDEDGGIQGSFYPSASQNRTYFLTHRISIAGTKNAGKSVETSFEAEYGSNGVPTGNLRLVGGSANEKFLIQNIGILSVNGINFDCRHGKVTLSHNLAVPGITVSGVTYTAKYLSSEGMYVLGSLA